MPVNKKRTASISPQEWAARIIMPALQLKSCRLRDLRHWHLCRVGQSKFSKCNLERNSKCIFLPEVLCLEFRNLDWSEPGS